MSRLSVNAKDLAARLSLVKNFVSEGAALLPVYRRMVFSRKTVLGQNGNAGILTSSGLEAPPDGVSLDGSRLLRFAELLGDAELTYEFADSCLSVHGGGSRASFALAGIADVPFPQWPKRQQLLKVSDCFIPAMRSVLFSGDQSGNAGPLSSVCIIKTGVLSTDAARATYVPVSGLQIGDMNQVLVPASLIQILPQVDTSLSWAPIGGLAWFEWDGLRVWLRTAELEFPDLSSVFRKAVSLSKTPEAVMEYSPAEMSVAVETAAFAGGFQLACSVKGKTLAISCKGELVEARLERAVSASGAATFFVAAQKFQDAVQRYGKLFVCGDGLLLFEGDGARHILMELRNEDDEQKQPKA
jgi:hypothetical protein